LGHWINEFEETAIAILLGLMTLITFANVVLRYGFNTGLIWGLEATTFLFAWLVLFGVSYAVKVTAHFCTENTPHSDADRGCGLRGLCWVADERGLGLLGQFRQFASDNGPLVSNRL
jgi:hypothetical protein